MNSSLGHMPGLFHYHSAESAKTFSLPLHWSSDLAPVIVCPATHLCPELGALKNSHQPAGSLRSMRPCNASPLHPKEPEDLLLDLNGRLIRNMDRSVSLLTSIPDLNLFHWNQISDLKRGFLFPFLRSQ
jgi:hypothetical protein